MGKNDWHCTGLVDSGNVWKTAISDELARKLEIEEKDLERMSVDSIGTAKKGSSLKILGQVKKPIMMKLGDHPTRIAVRPVVIENLSMGMNLSGPFLKAYGIDQLHSQNALSFQGRLIPLKEANEGRREAKYAEITRTKIYVEEDQWIKPDEEKQINAVAPLVQKGQMLPGDVIVRGSERFMNQTDLHPMMNAVTTVDSEGRVPVRVWNTSGADIKIKAGTCYGQVHLIEELTPQPAFPARISAITIPEDDEFEKAYEEGQRKAGGKGHETSGKVWSDAEKRRFLRAEFRLDECDCLTTEDERVKAETLLMSFWDVISTDGEFGHTDLVEHAIPTPEGMPPINCKERPINPVVEAELKKQLLQWLKTGVIQPSNSGYKFPLVAVPKKNGSIRFCVDFRRLNAASGSVARDAFPMPNINSNLSKLAGSKVFSSLDNAGAYHVVKIRKEDRHKTAFSACGRLWEFVQLAFGLQYAPATFCRLVEKALGQIPSRYLLTYLDDSILHTTTLKEHFNVLAEVLKAYRKAGMRLQPKKCSLFRSTVTYLGHKVSADGTRPVPEYLEIVRDWPLPRTKSQARAFVGKMSYYRRYCKDFSRWSRPWTDVMGKTTAAAEKEPLEVTNEMKESFHKLKKILLSAPVLAYPDFSDEAGPFIVDSDWSQEHNTIGGVLSQRQADGTEKVICYGAKKLDEGKKSYTPFQGELLAVIEFLKMWKFYLFPRPFILRTDHEPLKWIRTLEQPSAMVLRWLQTLANFQFEVKHRAGTRHGNADSLSRVDHAKALEPDELDDEMEGLGYLGAVRPILKSPFGPEEVAQAQRDDPDYRQLKLWIRQKIKPDAQQIKMLGTQGRHLVGLLPDLYEDENEVIKRLLPEGSDLAWVRDSVVCVPEALQDQLIRYCHEAGGHQARDATWNRAKEFAFFPGMRASIEHYVQTCKTCQEAKRKPTDQRHTYEHAQEASYAWQAISCDFVGPLPRSKNGNAFLFTVKDLFSRYFLAFPIPRATAEIAADVLEREVFCKFGICERVHSDQGTQFTGRLWAAMADALGITLTTTPSFNPKSNSVERTHRDLGAMLRKAISENLDWEEVLPQSLFAINTSPNRSTGVEPFRMVFGRLPATPLHVAFGSPPATEVFNEQLTFQEYAKRLQQRVKLVQNYARINLRKALIRQRRVYHHQRRLFLPGQKVWLFTPTVVSELGKKLTRYWSGPWRIARKVNDLLYEIAPHAEMASLRPPQVVSIDRLMIYRERGPAPRTGRPVVPLADSESEGELDEFAEVVPEDANADPEPEADAGGPGDDAVLPPAQDEAPPGGDEDPEHPFGAEDIPEMEPGRRDGPADDFRGPADLPQQPGEDRNFGARPRNLGRPDADMNVTPADMSWDHEGDLRQHFYGFDDEGVRRSTRPNKGVPPLRYGYEAIQCPKKPPKAPFRPRSTSTPARSRSRSTPPHSAGTLPPPPSPWAFHAGAYSPASPLPPLPPPLRGASRAPGGAARARGDAHQFHGPRGGGAARSRGSAAKGAQRKQLRFN